MDIKPKAVTKEQQKTKTNKFIIISVYSNKGINKKIIEEWV